MGPLKGIKIVEIAGLAPGPFAGMMLADMGADVIRVVRPGGLGFGVADPRYDFLNRGKRCVSLNLKDPEGAKLAVRMIEKADGLIEGMRPGAMERLGLGPEACLAANPRLIYGRLTGWGQAGPLAERAGHDLNYVALAGVLHDIGPKGGKPCIPLNFLGDFGGGGLVLAFGMVCALLEARGSGRGQVIDAAMIDGAALLAASHFGMVQAGLHAGPRGSNLLDGGAPFYGVYECADGKFLSVAPIEPKFYVELLEKLDLTDIDPQQEFDVTSWPKTQARFAERILSKTRDEWCTIFEGSDACVAPVLAPSELPEHPHHQARESFMSDGQVWQPRPAPRFGRSQVADPEPTRPLGADNEAVLAELGLSTDEIQDLSKRGVIV